MKDTHCDRQTRNRRCVEVLVKPGHSRGCGRLLFTDLPDEVGFAAVWVGTWEPCHLGGICADYRGLSSHAAGDMRSLGGVSESNFKVLGVLDLEAAINMKAEAQHNPCTSKQCLTPVSSPVADDLTQLFYRYCFGGGLVRLPQHSASSLKASIYDSPPHAILQPVQDTHC